MTDRTDLRAALAKVQPGDHLTVTVGYDGHTATLTGEAWLSFSEHLSVGTTIIRYDDGKPSGHIAALIEHVPALPPEPKVGSLRVCNGKTLRRRFANGWAQMFHDGSWGGIRLSWAEMQTYDSLTDPMEVVK